MGPDLTTIPPYNIFPTSDPSDVIGHHTNPVKAGQATILYVIGGYVKQIYSQ